MEEPPDLSTLSSPPPTPPPPLEPDAVPRGATGFEQGESGLLRDHPLPPTPGLADEDGRGDADLPQPDDATAAAATGCSPVATAPDVMYRSGDEGAFLSYSFEAEEGGDPQCESIDAGVAAGDLIREGFSAPFVEENQLPPSSSGAEVEELILGSPLCVAGRRMGELMPQCPLVPSPFDGDDAHGKDERADATEPNTDALVAEQMEQLDEENQQPSATELNIEVLGCEQMDQYHKENQKPSAAELNTEALEIEQMNQFNEEDQQPSAADLDTKVPGTEQKDKSEENQQRLPLETAGETSYQEFKQDFREVREMEPQTSPPASRSSSSEEDEKTALSEDCTAYIMGHSQKFEQEDAEDMMPRDSPPASLSSSSEGDEKTALSEPDTAGTADASGDAQEEGMEVDVEEAELSGNVRRGGRRRKRGRPPKAQVSRAPRKRKDKSEEEVCFICFDGGDLVVCDRRGCPKVYHPSCVDRDEAFFRAKGRWNCGWHICSNCQKAAHFMCFTCTHSLCRGCFKDAAFFSVRGNKGFCQTCMSTVMLIEAKDGNERMVGVDFDDKTSFEYLFKDYWLDLKAKLSLTLEELIRAKNMSKGSEQVTPREISDDLHDGHEEIGAGSDNYSRHQDESSSSRSKGRKRSRKNENSAREDQNAGTSFSEEMNWASEELLEFVAHMRNGDRSVLSQFEVQALLLEYIKRNNLRDPRKKSQIICDLRLENLFGKSRVGHFEMLKLLESHFLLKEALPLETEDHLGGVEDPDPSQTGADGNYDALGKLISDKRKRSRKKGDEREHASPDDYAAIDVHNISLMYLRRNLMEELISDSDTFHEKVVGSFVRIRISGASQRQDVYRLVQVIDTGRATEAYKSGKKLTDVTLEILNLDKKEIITIDIISNQEFSEEECKRLRQSIKCGLIPPLRVGEVLDKARAIQVVKVNDWMESEKLRLSHLRDRASEKGRRKELRECVEKLQLLSMPEERRRRLNEIPEIHTDPHMDPEYESPEEEEPVFKRRDFLNRSRGNPSSRSGKELKSPGKGSSSDNWSSHDNSNIWESSRNISVEGAHTSGNSGSRFERELSSKQSFDSHKAANSGAPKDQAVLVGSQGSLWDDRQHAAQPAEPSAVSLGKKSVPVPVMVTSSSKSSESEKIWHYQDPSRKIQGPFSMAQLRKWSTNGYFPTNLRIWRVSEKQDDSILLNDALVGNFQQDLPQWEPPINSPSRPRNALPTLKIEENTMDYSGRESNAVAVTENKQNGENGRLGGHEKWASQPSAVPSSNAESGQMLHQNTPRPLAQVNINTSLPACNQGVQGYDSLGRNLEPTSQPSVQGHLDPIDKSETTCAQPMSYGRRANSSSEEDHSSAITEFKQIPGDLPVPSLPSGGEMNQQSNAMPFHASDSVDKGSSWKDQQAPVGFLSSEHNQAAIVGTSGSTICIHSEGSTLAAVVKAPPSSELSVPGMRLEASSSVISQPFNPENYTMSAGNSSIHSHLLPVTNSGWNNTADTTFSSSQNVQLLPSGISNPMAPSQFGANASVLPGQPSPAAFNLAVGAQNSNTGPIAHPGSSNASIIQLSQGMHGDMNASWGTQGNTNVNWGQTVQPNANANMGFPVPQVNMLMNPGWAAPAQGNTNMNMGWVTPSVGNMNELAGWGPQMQGNMALNQGWGMVANSFPVWATNPANTNQSWGNTPQGNMSNNAGESGQGSSNHNWAPSAENADGCGTQQKESGDRHQGRHSSPGNREFRQSGWRQRMPTGKSPQPSSGGRGGICRFHEAGHCKKGASCNYFHP